MINSLVENVHSADAVVLLCEPGRSLACTCACLGGTDSEMRDEALLARYSSFTLLAIRVIATFHRLYTYYLHF